jgi:hypothetical protein
VWKACFEVPQRPRQRLWSANIAMHLSRRRNVLFFAEKTLRPGDGKRSKDREEKAGISWWLASVATRAWAEAADLLRIRPLSA